MYEFRKNRTWMDELMYLKAEVALLYTQFNSAYDKEALLVEQHARLLSALKEFLDSVEILEDE